MKPSSGILTIDLSAIQENWRRLNRAVSSANVAAVIKADSYGLGAHRIGPLLAEEGCRSFFVATLYEGLAARKYLPASARVFVLGGSPAGTEDLFVTSNLIPVLFSVDAVRRWQSFVVARQITPACAIKIDTGMTRMGLSLAEFAELCGTPTFAINVQLIMSHLACAEDTEHPLNRLQLTRLASLQATAKKQWPQVEFSLSNSSGIFLGPEWHFDWVRPGAALYGINPTPGKSSPVVPVIRLALPVMQKRELTETATLGYGAEAKLSPPARVLAVAGGYADGLHRILGPRGEGWIGRERVPVIGRISMDITLFDASALTLEAFARVEEIEIINTEQDVNMLSARNTALGYEVLTSLGSRFQRRYLPPKSGEEVAS
mgnify:CR=1 FL=1|jgi:alanine racemase